MSVWVMPVFQSELIPPIHLEQEESEVVNSCE